MFFIKIKSLASQLLRYQNLLRVKKEHLCINYSNLYKLRLWMKKDRKVNYIN